MAYAAAIAVTSRLTLLLPAQAIGNTGLTIKQVWRRTRGNIWRLLWGIFATTIPPLLMIVPIGIGFLSYAYRHFFQAPLEPAE